VESLTMSAGVPPGMVMTNLVRNSGDTGAL
jgi:hypothetical protein